jgi:exosome complex RNA-binding protein Csl4
LTHEGLDQIRKIRENLNTSRVLVESEPACLEGGSDLISKVDAVKRTLVKPISVQEVKSGKTRNFSSIKEAYLFLSNINKVSVSTISRYLDTGKSVKGYIFFSENNTN